MMLTALAASVYVYVGTMGQSDGVGANADAVGTVTPPYATRALMLNDTWGTRGPGDYLYSQYQTTGATTLVPAHETNGPMPPLLAKDGYGETHVTSMIAEPLHEGSPYVYIGRSDAAPGRPLSSLMRGGRPYFNALTDLTKANALTAQRKIKMINPAVAMIAGDSDRTLGTPAQTYIDESIALAQSWTADVQAVTGQTFPVVFFQTQLAAPHAGSGDILLGVGSPIEQAQLDLAITSPYYRIASPSYMFGFSPNATVHWSAFYQRMQGEYLGRAMNSELVKKVRWKPLYPLAIAFKASDHSKIEVSLSVPVQPIVRDYVNMPQGFTPNDGFTFKDACNDAKVIKDTITGTRTIEIQLSAVPKCASPMLNYAYDYQNGTKIATLPNVWGTIRDSDLTRGWAGDRLRNWLVVFSEPVA
jgi:hypothetical protein